MQHPAVSGARDSTARSAPAIALAALAALLASGCCVLPLVLAVVGISGAWISQLRLLQPYSNSLIAVAVGALGVAAWRLFRAQTEVGQAAIARAEQGAGIANTVGAACDATGAACGASNRTARRWFWWVALLAMMPLLVPMLAPLLYD